MIIGSLFGNNDHESSLLKPYEEAMSEAKQKLEGKASNEGVDTTLWWKGSAKDGDNN
ncbi:hypothetical protein [Enterococcus sp. AZ109]|uniref:hypothetical protein n=1 Tax=Enterococcus sp. AZ109 TaxID=2774634 RepID=UPI003F68427C